MFSSPTGVSRSPSRTTTSRPIYEVLEEIDAKDIVVIEYIVRNFYVLFSRAFEAQRRDGVSLLSPKTREDVMYENIEPDHTSRSLRLCIDGTVSNKIPEHVHRRYDKPNKSDRKRIIAEFCNLISEEFLGLSEKSFVKNYEDEFSSSSCPEESVSSPREEFQIMLHGHDLKPAVQLSVDFVWTIWTAIEGDIDKVNHGYFTFTDRSVLNYQVLIRLIS